MNHSFIWEYVLSQVPDNCWIKLLLYRHEYGKGFIINLCVNNL